MMDLSKYFWDDRYKANDTGWDLGMVSPPLKAYFDQLTNKNLRILIPGGGNSYEAEYLHHQGFNQVYVVDISETALQNIKTRVPSFPSAHLIKKDFFDLEMTFDLIIEQTFFCAIDPKLRSDYSSKAFELLKQKGKLVGLMFDAPLHTDKPPFGGSKKEYVAHFQPNFDILLLESAHNSHTTRVGKELFIKMKKNKDSF